MVVIVRELNDQIIKVPLAEDDELVQTLQLDRLDEPLTPTVQVGTGLRQRVGSQPPRFQLRRKLLGELGVFVVHHDVGLLLATGSLIDEQVRLLLNPG